MKADESELNNYACFPNVSVDRLALNIIKDGEPAVEIDSSFELVIEKNKLVNPDTEPIKGAIYAENLTMYLERKLYIVNCGHAAAAYLGTVIGKKAVEAGIEEVVFDRGGYIYHGKVKALADAAREAGLKF